MNYNNLLTFQIINSLKFSIFSHNEDEYLHWIYEKDIYFFKFFKSEKNHKDLFINILDHCLYSIINNIFFEDSYIKYIQKLGIIKDLESYANQVLSLNESSKIVINQIINLDVAKKIFNAKGEIYNYDYEKDSLIKISGDKKIILTIYCLDSTKFDYILCSETLVIF